MQSKYWQYRYRCICSIGINVVAILGSMLWKHCDRCCGSTAIDVVEALESMLWKHCDRCCGSTGIDVVEALGSILWRHWDRCCGSTGIDVVEALGSIYMPFYLFRHHSWNCSLYIILCLSTIVDHTERLGACAMLSQCSSREVQPYITY